MTDLTGSPRPSADAASGVRQLGLLLRRTMLGGLRTPVISYLFPVVVPTVLFLLTSQMFREVGLLPGFPAGGYVQFIFPSVMLLTPMTGAGYGPTGLILDATGGFLDRMQIVPVRLWVVISSRVAFEILRVIPAFFVMSGCGALVGVEFAQGAASMAGLLLLVALWAAAYSGLFYAVGIYTLNAQAPTALLPIALPVFFASTAVMPRALLPSWLRAVVSVNPFTYIIEAARSVVTGPLSGSTLAGGLLTALAVLVVSQGAVALVARRRLVP